MWACGACGRTFANRNQVHTCAPLGDLDRHSAEVSPLARATFDRVLEVVRSLGRLMSCQQRPALPGTSG